MKKKNIIFVAGIVLVLIVITLILNINITRTYQFEDGFKELQKIDEKYGTNFHEEILNRNMINIDDAQLILEDIKEFENSLNKKVNTPHMEALFLFIDVRKLMITSQWYLGLAQTFGDEGLVNDPAGFSCIEAEKIINVAFYFNESAEYAFFAMDELDDLIYSYQEIPDLWNIVGTDENKTRFYLSDLDSMKQISANNVASIKEFCPVEIPPFESTLTQRFTYERKDPRDVKKELLAQGFAVENRLKDI